MKNWIFLAAFIAFFALSCSKETSENEEIARPVKAILIGAPESTIMRVFPGITLATNETTLAFQIPGQVIEFPVLEGTHVDRGRVIAVLDSLTYQEKVNETKAKLVRDKANYARASTLLKSAFISVADYDRVKSAYLVSQADYNTALNDLKNTKLMAPFSGVIAKKFVKNYEYITAKQPIVLLQDTDNIDIEINVPENVVVTLKTNQVAIEKMIALFDAIPNQTFNVTLKEYSSQADPQTQTFRIVFTMKRPKNFNVLPGMTVSIHAPLGNTVEKTFFIVPSSAVFINESNQAAIWLIDTKTMRVQSKTVTTASLTHQQIKVLAGLKQGDWVVISGVHFLREKQLVKILKE